MKDTSGPALTDWQCQKIQTKWTIACISGIQKIVDKWMKTCRRPAKGA